MHSITNFASVIFQMIINNFPVICRFWRLFLSNWILYLQSIVCKRNVFCYVFCKENSFAWLFQAFTKHDSTEFMSILISVETEWLRFQSQQEVNTIRLWKSVASSRQTHELQYSKNIHTVNSNLQEKNGHSVLFFSHSKC